MERKREFQGGNKTGLLNFVKVSSFWYNLIIFKSTFCPMTMVKYATIVQLHNRCRLYPLRDHSLRSSTVSWLAHICWLWGGHGGWWQGTEFSGHGSYDATTRSASERSLILPRRIAKKGGNLHLLSKTQEHGTFKKKKIYIIIYIYIYRSVLLMIFKESKLLWENIALISINYIGGLMVFFHVRQGDQIKSKKHLTHSFLNLGVNKLTSLWPQDFYRSGRGSYNRGALHFI